MEPNDRDRDRDFDARGRGYPAGDAAPPVGRLTPSGPARARTALVVLIVFLVELVIVAGGGNQGVSKQLQKHATGGSHSAIVIQGWLGHFSWRFQPVGGHDVGHLWLAQLLAVVAFLVLSTLLIIAVVRGVVTFWRAFFGTWAAVVFATLLADIVRAAIPPHSTGNGGVDRADAILISNDVPAVAVAFGLLMALITAILAVATRRTPMSEQPVVPEAAPADYGQPPTPPPPFFGAGPESGPASAPWDAGSETGLVGEPAAARHATEDQRRAEARRWADAESANETREFPTFDRGPVDPAAQPPESATTAAFPPAFGDVSNAPAAGESNAPAAGESGAPAADEPSRAGGFGSSAPFAPPLPPWSTRPEPSSSPEPSASEPSASEPSASEPSASEPSASEPPVADSSATTQFPRIPVPEDPAGRPASEPDAPDAPDAPSEPDAPDAPDAPSEPMPPDTPEPAEDFPRPPDDEQTLIDDAELPQRSEDAPAEGDEGSRPSS